jgi:hypothetical protein
MAQGNLLLAATVCLLIGGSCIRHSHPIPVAETQAAPTLDDDKKLFELIKDKLVRVEVVSYRGAAERIGPICIKDERGLAQIKTILTEVRDIRRMDNPHAQFTEADEDILTFVFQEIAQVHGRVVGPMLILFNDERCFGLMPASDFRVLMDRLIEKHRVEHPEDWLRTKPPTY